jgi:hypothetical protein
MFANTLDVNGAAKVYILGRRMDKLQEVASAAVWNSPHTLFSNTHKLHRRRTNPSSQFNATSHPTNLSQQQQSK